MIEPTGRPHLGRGVRQFQSTLWATNSVLVSGVDGTLVFDPSLAPSELEQIRSAAMRTKSPVAVFITHSHFDHTCGVGAFPDAEVFAGETTVGVIRAGEAARQLDVAGREWGMHWEGELRADRALSPGMRLSFGGVEVEVIDAGGNTCDGVAYLLPEHRVLIAGDFMSSVTYPSPEGAIAQAVDTYERLLKLLEEGDVAWVVPGHGLALNGSDARTIALADLNYLTALDRATVEAGEAELSPGHALLHVYGVEPPRAVLPEFELYNPRVRNAQHALQTARAEATAGDDRTWRLAAT